MNYLQIYKISTIFRMHTVKQNIIIVVLHAETRCPETDKSCLKLSAH